MGLECPNSLVTAKILEQGWCQSMAWHGMEWHGMEWHSMAQHSMAQHAMLWHNFIWHDTAQYGVVWHGKHGTSPGLPLLSQKSHPGTPAPQSHFSLTLTKHPAAEKGAHLFIFNFPAFPIPRAGQSLLSTPGRSRCSSSGVQPPPAQYRPP